MKLPFRLLLLVLVIFVPLAYSRAPFRSKKSPRETIHNYDIVYLEINDPPQSNEIYPRSMQVAIKNDSVVLFNLELILNEGLIPPHFTSAQEGSNEVNQGHPNCFYHGTVKGRTKWSAVFSSCHGLRGWFGDLHNSKESVYHLEPLNDAKELSEPHVLYRDTEHMEAEPGTCGTPHVKGTPHGEGQHNLITTPQKINGHHRMKRASTANTSIVELLVVNDYYQYQAYSNNISTVVLRAVEIINHVDWLYSAINVRVSLVHSLTWTTSQQIVFQNVAGELLNLFKEYHSDHIPFRSITHDSVQMITGIDLAGSTIGIAYVGTMCSYENSVGVTQDTRGSIASVASTAAHEMGHTFNMDHDDSPSCNCPITTGQGCIMNAQAGFPPATNWSQCSVNELNNGFLTRRLNRCLGNSPTTIVGDSKCGNGIKEPGEICDCGSLAECDDPCCNATTCTLNDDADCGFGACCDNCKFVAYGTTCRDSSNQCDLMEYCTGNTSDCPQDVGAQNGFPCSNSTGYCYGAECRSHALQCNVYYGESSTSSNQLCYTHFNTRGEGSGHCGSNGQSFIGCSMENAQCGSLQCQGGRLQNVNTRNSYVSYTNYYSNFECRTFTTSATVDEVSPGLVADGTKCGNISLCISQRCVTLASLNIPPCPLGSNGMACSGNGVCNNLDKCSCDIGFMGTNCGQAFGRGGGGDGGGDGDGGSGSTSSNSAVVGGAVGGIFVMIIVIVTAVVVIVVVLLVVKKRKKSVDLMASPSKAKYTRAPTNNKVTVPLSGSTDDLLMTERTYTPSQTSPQPPAYNPYVPPTYSPSGGSNNGTPSVTVNNTRGPPPPRPAPPPVSSVPSRAPTRAPPPKPPAPANRPSPKSSGPSRPPPPPAAKPSAPFVPTVVKPSAPPKPQTAPKPSRVQWPPPSTHDGGQQQKPPPPVKKPIPPPRK